jgi:hypothetical protein
MKRFKNWMLAPLFIVSLGAGAATSLRAGTVQAKPGGDIPIVVKPGGGDGSCYCEGCLGFWNGYCSPCYGSGAGCEFIRCTAPWCEVPGSEYCVPRGTANPACRANTLGL